VPAFIFIAESAALSEYPDAPIPRLLLAFPMSEGHRGPYDSVARRWLALVERRQENFIELCDTGRWRHYYTHDEFLIEMRKVLRLRDQWAAIVGVPATNGVPSDANLYSGQIFAFPHRVDASAELLPLAWQSESDAA
jgi:hypothetical protein